MTDKPQEQPTGFSVHWLLFPLTSEFALKNECEFIMYVYYKNSHHLSLARDTRFSHLKSYGNLLSPQCNKLWGYWWSTPALSLTPVSQGRALMESRLWSIDSGTAGLRPSVSLGEAVAVHQIPVSRGEWGPRWCRKLVGTMGTPSLTLPWAGGRKALGGHNNQDDLFCLWSTWGGFGGEAFVSGSKLISRTQAQHPVH